MHLHFKMKSPCSCQLCALVRLNLFLLTSLSTHSASSVFSLRVSVCVCACLCVCVFYHHYYYYSNHILVKYSKFFCCFSFSRVSDTKILVLDCSIDFFLHVRWVLLYRIADDKELLVNIIRAAYFSACLNFPTVSCVDMLI